MQSNTPFYSFRLIEVHIMVNFAVYDSENNTTLLPFLGLIQFLFLEMNIRWLAFISATYITALIAETD